MYNVVVNIKRTSGGIDMTTQEQRRYLIQTLLAEDERLSRVQIPENEDEQERMLRTLVNIRPPKAISKEFLEVQDAYLQTKLADKTLITPEDLTKKGDNLYLWRGDITNLKVDAIVNAANNQLLGCFVPNHSCIDNAIHTFAGVQLREECFELMQQKGHPEETGRAEITKGYNLPSKYVIHTVGPIVSGELTKEHERLLASSYRSCLELAQANGLKSIAFCCISTGVFNFPNERAAQIAVETIKEFLKENNSEMKVIFNVFKEDDEKIYTKLLK